MALKAHRRPVESTEINECTNTLETLKNPREQKLEAQRNEFYVYLSKKIETDNSFSFIDAMFQKIDKGEPLSPNIENAIRKCMKSDADRKVQITEGTENPPKITLKIRKWLMTENKLGSRVITGVVLRETQKAYLVKGHANVIEGNFCMRCGQELTEPASMIIGFGAVCCGHLGIEYPGEILTISKKERKAIRSRMMQILHAQKFEIWIPKSQVEEVIEGAKERTF